MGRECSTNREDDELIVGKSGGKRPLGRPRGRW
jgi:hypothetical protein